MFQGHFGENIKITRCYVGAANAVACDVIDMSNFEKGAFLIVHNGSTDTDLVLSLYEATDVAAGTNAAITTTVPIYIDADAGTSSDTLAATTAAYSVTIDPATQGSAIILMEIDPSILSQGYPCVYLSDSGGNASNTCTILFLGVPRVKGQTLPSAIA